LCSPVVAIDLVGSSRKPLFREHVCGTTTPFSRDMSGWGASLHASNQNSLKIFQLVKKGKWPKKTAKSVIFEAESEH
jgi:hypothetical protein